MKNGNIMTTFLNGMIKHIVIQALTISTVNQYIHFLSMRKPQELIVKLDGNVYLVKT